MELNRLRQLRTKKKMSQGALAKAVKTSQQQIQRIESGQTVKYDMALDLCAALGCALEELFPQGRKALQKIAQQSPRYFMEIPENVAKEASAAGVEFDPMDYFAKVEMRGGLLRDYSISRDTAHRLERYLDQHGSEDEDNDEPFFEFDSDDHVVVVARQELRYVHFLWDAGDNRPKEEHDPCAVRIYFKGSLDPTIFECDPDPQRAQDEELGDMGEFVHGLVNTARLHNFRGFRDLDGEYVSLNVGALAVVEVPHYLLDRPDDEEEDEPQEVERPPTASGD